MRTLAKSVSALCFAVGLLAMAVAGYLSVRNGPLDMPSLDALFFSLLLIGCGTGLWIMAGFAITGK